MDDVKQLPGARESSAGDDFHLLWAGRKALSLLMPNSDLRALSIEGPHREEANCLDPEGDQLLAIDLAEYYGGDRFDSAKLIVFSQLTYSTRTPEKEWTASLTRREQGSMFQEKRKSTSSRKMERSKHSESVIASEADQLYLQVVKDNLPALSLYRKHGFSPLSEHHYRLLEM